jgi:hypothetical protein
MRPPLPGSVADIELTGEVVLRGGRVALDNELPTPADHFIGPATRQLDLAFSRL